MNQYVHTLTGESRSDLERGEATARAMEEELAEVRGEGREREEAMRAELSALRGSESRTNSELREVRAELEREARKMRDEVAKAEGRTRSLQASPPVQPPNSIRKIPSSDWSVFSSKTPRAFSATHLLCNPGMVGVGIRAVPLLRSLRSRGGHAHPRTSPDHQAGDVTNK